MPDALTLNTLVFIAFGLATLSILLGFIALLTQRTYLDAKTQEPIDIDIPLLGRMKTNYPALVFVFLGFFLAFYVLLKALPPSEKQQIDWVINGSFADPQINDWKTRGQLTLHPPGTYINVDETGRFSISMKINEGKTFEDIVERLTYTRPDRADAELFPREEYSAHQKGGPSRLDKASAHIRTYKPILLQPLGVGR